MCAVLAGCFVSQNCGHDSNEIEQQPNTLTTGLGTEQRNHVWI